MGWGFRRSVNFGPFRMNMSKSGMGYSVGGAGFRTGVSAKGRRFTRLSIPGTGIYYTKSGNSPSGVNPTGVPRPAGTGCLVLLVACCLACTGVIVLFIAAL